MKNKENPEDDYEDELEIEEEDDKINDEIVTEKEDEKESLFPFDKMLFQEKNENDIHEYEMGTNQELDLGESEKRSKKRTLGEERGSGHEP